MLEVLTVVGAVIGFLVVLAIFVGWADDYIKRHPRR